MYFCLNTYKSNMWHIFTHIIGIQLKFVLNWFHLRYLYKKLWIIILIIITLIIHEPMIFINQNLKKQEENNIILLVVNMQGSRQTWLFIIKYVKFYKKTHIAISTSTCFLIQFLPPYGLTPSNQLNCKKETKYFTRTSEKD